MSLSELGAYLQRHREEQGLSLEAVEEATRIRRVHLEAIESGRWEGLPPGVYVRGLLKSYAKVLGLSPETVLRMYLKEHPGEDAPAAPRNILSQPLLREPRLSLESVLAVVFIAAAAAIGWWLWLAFVGPMLRSPAPGTPTVAATAGAASAGATATAPPARPTARPTAAAGIPTAVALLPLESPSPEGSATAAGATGSPAATVATVATAAGPPPSATRPAGAAASATSRATATPPRAPATATQPRASATAGPRTATPGGPTATPRPTTFAGGLRLSLRSTGSIWVSVVLDGKRPPAFEGFLRKGENDLWEGQARTVINLRTGNAGETEVSLNGQRLPSLGKAGEVKNVEWRLLPDGRVQQTP